MKKIDKSVLDSAMSYSEYRKLIDELLIHNKSTGDYQSESMLHYSKLNVARMKRLDKTTKISEEGNSLLQQIREPLIWLVITEGWCGDAAQVIPIMVKFAEANPNIDLRLILRDEHLEIMDAFLTNGGRSIPKLIALNPDSLEVLGSWGPRPAVPQEMVMTSKKKAENIQDKENQKAYLDEVKKDVQKWYARDKTRSIQTELLKAALSFEPEIV